MANFHSADPNLIVNALRLILDGYKFLRSRNGKGAPDKEEEVLEKAVSKAEEMSGRGAPAETVTSEIETNLERDLGKAVKDEIINRASSILALAQPFDLEAFQYYECLNKVLKQAQDYCTSARIFQLRGANNGAFSVLRMPALNLALQHVTRDFEFSCGQLRRAQGIIKVAATSTSYLVTKAEGLHVSLAFALTRARSTGGTYLDDMTAGLALSSGSEVNKVGFNVVTAESPFVQSFEIRITGNEFEQILSALLDDLNKYTADLANEQQQFKEEIAPQFDAVLRTWAKPNKITAR